METLRIAYPETEKAFLESLNEESAILNGGTDIHVKIRAGKWPYTRLISLERIESLKGISEEGKYVRIRCRTTFSELLAHPLIQEHFPLLWRASYEVGSNQIRNRGTLVGNVVNASPAGDGILALSVYDAWLEMWARKGQ
jgi:xanthine dehydrogenase FAD-binding subunit